MESLVGLLEGWGQHREGARRGLTFEGAATPELAPDSFIRGASPRSYTAPFLHEPLRPSQEEVMSEQKTVSGCSSPVGLLSGSSCGGMFFFFFDWPCGVHFIWLFRVSTETGNGIHGTLIYPVSEVPNLELENHVAFKFQSCLQLLLFIYLVS